MRFRWRAKAVRRLRREANEREEVEPGEAGWLAAARIARGTVRCNEARFRSVVDRDPASAHAVCMVDDKETGGCGFEDRLSCS